MSDILDASGHKMATIGEDNKVRDLHNVIIGSVSSDGHVFSVANQRIGYVDAKGYVFEGVSHVGTVHVDGAVYDENNHLIGKVAGGHVESGGAALLLLVR